MRTGSRTGSSRGRKQSEQTSLRCPDFPHPRHFLQLFQGDPEAFPGHIVLQRSEAHQSPAGVLMQRWVVICWALLALVGADECPDGGRCGDGQTCCNNPDKGYECCPFDQAECCGDHMHCCPGGTICDFATSSCMNATGSVPWVERTSADQPRLSKSFRMIRTHMGEEDDNICPDQSRCPPEFSCLRALTRFGCCPIAQGVPCSDGKHCCPEGHQCSADSRSCIKKELVTSVLCGDGESECPDETTCCENPEGKWGCCPMPKAVCCDDKKHCCPEGTTCDVEHSKCISSSTKKPVPMWAKLPARIRADWENQKEGEQVTAKGVDDAGSETANTVPPSEKEVTVSSVAKAAPGNNVPCDDQVACEDGTTCCKTQEGGWACCPMPEAVCCEDFIHCCPKGTKCNLAAQTCDDAAHSMPWFKKVPAAPRQDVLVGDVACDSTHSCPDGSTCCKTKTDEWACCPLPQAVCCDDHEHCCPAGTTCDPAGLSCDGASGRTPMQRKIPAFVKEGPTTPQSTVIKGNNVPCDDQVACEDGTTCCKTQEGGWACCPMPEAVCCEDFIHCCPKGTKCNLAAQTCDDAAHSMPWFKKVPAAPRQDVLVGDVACDSTHSCPDGSTCCKTKTDEWACCPLPQAVCCDDHEHCCPAGTTCDPAGLSCDGASGRTPMQRKIPAFVKEGPTTPQSTVIKGEDKKEPEKDEAVCCEDFIHCCPKGTKCNLAAQTCDDAAHSMPWFKKVPAAPRQDVLVGDVACDSTHSCPDGSTCCKTKTDEWACCPLPQVRQGSLQQVDDGIIHPNAGLVCKLQGIHVWAHQGAEVPEDDPLQCLHQAVCCDDHEHCCPAGTTCDPAGLSCDGASGRTPMQRKIPAFVKEGPTTPQSTVIKGNNVPCDDQVACEDGTTCCKTQEGGWACCPMPEAVCCEDFIHCCPKGTKCNLAAQTCDDAAHSMPWFKKVPAAPRQDVLVGDVACDSTHSCPDGSTCCKTKTDEWACCPLPQAVCCDDHEHCCPAGTTCDPAGLSCDGASGRTPMQRKIPAFVKEGPTTPQSTVIKGEDKKEPEKDEVKPHHEEGESKDEEGRVKCDDHTSCPQATTCCFMSSSQRWGCCPLPKAVCCADGNHCCPSDYKCDEQKNTCLKGEVVIPWYTKLPASTTAIRADPSTVQCDEHNQCPEQTTCCQLATGEWGCCPMPNAVCCSDEKHCCPQGYACDIASNSCQRVILLQVEMVPLTQVFLPERQPQLSPLRDTDVKCDDQTSCEDGQTCCRISATEWGCCPLPNAVCCSDMEYCCPAGYTCTEGGDCTQDTRLHWHMFLSNKKRALIV
ncbi:hypothetical protein L3Q82_013913 [Scortum barcoo]|uniref:Uncharacterized protein n=1 Tax=Scortum barcoo TaxID=214431 RepID=A0ACB8VUX5_9TELE|nr:hypothetical protein L3Q82_013913 [Scortum barcoo]